MKRDEYSPNRLEGSLIKSFFEYLPSVFVVPSLLLGCLVESEEWVINREVIKKHLDDLIPIVENCIPYIPSFY